MRSWREREFVGEREEEEEKGSKSRKSNDPAGFFSRSWDLSLSLQPQSFTHGLQPEEGRDKKASSSQRRRHRQRSPFPYPVRTLTEHGSKKTLSDCLALHKTFFCLSSCDNRSLKPPIPPQIEPRPAALRLRAGKKVSIKIRGLLVSPRPLSPTRSIERSLPPFSPSPFRKRRIRLHTPPFALKFCCAVAPYVHAGPLQEFPFPWVSFLQTLFPFRPPVCSRCPATVFSSFGSARGSISPSFFRGISNLAPPVKKEKENFLKAPESPP